jgi:hypothetical protein
VRWTSSPAWRPRLWARGKVPALRARRTAAGSQPARGRGTARTRCERLRACRRRSRGAACVCVPMLQAHGQAMQGRKRDNGRSSPTGHSSGSCAVEYLLKRRLVGR